VKAFDAAGNISAASAALSVTTGSASGCSEAPWNAAAAYAGGQRVSYNGIIYEAKWWTQGEQPDLSGEWGVWKVSGSCVGDGGDTVAPSVPTNLRSTGKTETTVNLAWDASADNVGVTGYTVTYGSTNVNVTGTTAAISGLAANTSYTFTVKSRDAAGNLSVASAPLSVTTSGTTGDTTPPSAPTNLAVAGKTSSSVSLSWTASTDNVGVTGYTVTYGSTSTTVTGTSATINGLAASTTYTFTVTARDAAGNVSGGASVQAATDPGSSPGVNAWAPNVAYKVGDLVTYGGKTYSCLQAHTSLLGWEPPNVPALWAVK
jgi:chitinase